MIQSYGWLSKSNLNSEGSRIWINIGITIIDVSRLVNETRWREPADIYEEQLRLEKPRSHTMESENIPAELKALIDGLTLTQNANYSAGTIFG